MKAADAAFVDSAFKEVLKRGNTIDLQLGFVLGRIKLELVDTKFCLLENFCPDIVRARAMRKPYTSQTPMADFG